MKRFLAILLLTTIPLGVRADGLWITKAEVAALPISGPAWNQLQSNAAKSFSGLNLSDQNDNREQYLLAAALVSVRTGDPVLRERVRSGIMSAIETENGGRTLALGRNLAAVVIAADLIELSGQDRDTFSDWLDEVRSENLDGRTLQSTHEDRPNNWGTMAGASRAAAAVFLGDDEDLTRTYIVFRGFLGDRTAYARFKYGDLDWQADPDNPVGINPLGATIDGYLVDGFIPDDLRRGGKFKIPPDETGYPWESLQGIVTQAEILHLAGYPVWTDEDFAIFRAVAALYRIGWEAEGDDEWILPLVVFRAKEALTLSGLSDQEKDLLGFVASIPITIPARHGKIMGWTDWTHGPGRTTGTVPDPTPDPDHDPEPDPEPTVNELIANPLELNFSYQVGGDLPDPQFITVTSTSPLDFVVDVDEPWIVPSTDVGTTPDDVGVGIDVSSLAVGTHTGSVLIESPEATNDPRLVVINVLVSSTPIPDPDPEPEPDPDPTDPVQSIDIPVVALSDDAEQRLRGTVSIKDGDLMLIDDSDNTHTAVRFQNLPIPKGATIVCASLKFTVNDRSEGACNLVIRAHDVGNSPTFVHGEKNGISSRQLTTESVDWTPEDWLVEDDIESTPCLGDLVEAIVNRDDWTEGNSMTFVLTGTGKREADAFRDDGRSSPTVLHLEWIE